MATPSSMSESGLTEESWVVVSQNEKQHTKERSPQYNHENECQAHLANTSSHGDSFVTFDTDTIDDATQALDLSRKTVSNVESADSTETGGTCETVMGPNIISPSSSVATLGTCPRAPILTEETLEKLQRELHHRFDGGIANWLEGAGWGDRFASNFATGSDPNSVLGGGGQSTQSRASSVSLGFVQVPPHRTFTNDTRGLGAWCQ